MRRFVVKAAEAEKESWDWLVDISPEYDGVRLVAALAFIYKDFLVRG